MRTNNQSAVLKAAREGSERYFDRQMALLERFCSIDCGSRNVEGNRQVVEIVDEILLELGAEISHIDAPDFGTHVVGRISGKKPNGKIILNAHLDTVFDKGEVAEHPFRIEGEFAYGLGIADCKGGVVTSAYAVKGMMDAGLLPDREIVLIYNCDEESGSPHGKHLFYTEGKDAERVFCFEPGRGENGILTSRKGAASGTISVKGKTAHAQRFDEGASAVYELAKIIVKLHELSGDAVGLQYNFGHLLSDGEGKLTSIVPDHAKTDYFVSLDSAESFDLAQRLLEELPKVLTTPGCSIDESTLQLFIPAMSRTKENIWLYETVRAAGKLIGQDLPEEPPNASGDCNYFSGMGLPVVDGLGPYMYDIHTVKERIRIASLRERTELFGIVLGLI